MARESLTVRTTRGSVVELVSRVNAVIVDRDAHAVEGFGEFQRRVPVRSTAKPLQALAMVETGAADSLTVTAAELALACASHNGEDAHAAQIEEWLARLGLGEDNLRCGASLPYLRSIADEYVAHGGQPRRLRHNCSGKHTGFLSLAAHLGADPKTYLDRAGHVQRAVLVTVAERCGMSLGDDDIVQDGCGAPCPCLSLEGLARGWSTLLDDSERASGRRVREAIVAHPFNLAGTGRFDTVIIELTGGRVISKVGADGLHVGISQEIGLVVAAKAVDGSRIAAEAALIHLLLGNGALTPDEAERLPRASVRDDAGQVVGAILVA